ASGQHRGAEERLCPRGLPGLRQRIVQGFGEPAVPFLPETADPPESPEAPAEGERALGLPCIVRNLDRLPEIVPLLLAPVEPGGLLRSEQLRFHLIGEGPIELPMPAHVPLPRAGSLEELLAVRAQGLEEPVACRPLAAFLGDQERFVDEVRQEIEDLFL